MIKIRKYCKKDLPLIRKISQDTAKEFFKKTLKRKEVISLMFLDYYLEFEPDNCFVCVNDSDNAVGYIVCSSNTKLFQEKMKSIYIPKLRKINPIYALFTIFSTKISKKTDLKYGPSFHINIQEEYQNMKLGPKLLTTLGKYLYDKKYKSMYLITQNRKTRGYPFYIHFGFKEVERLFLGSLVLSLDFNEELSKNIDKYL